MTALNNENGAATRPGDDAIALNDGSIVAAEAYLQRGWNIFPLRTGDKRPAIDWNGPSWATPPVDPAEFARRWWAGDANLAVATGTRSGIWVLDVDIKSGGIETMQALAAEHGQLPATFTVQTHSGGWHLYFAMPDFDLRNSAGRIGAGVDVRANGGYVVAAPSRISETGAEYVVTNHGPVAEAPQWLLDLAHKEHKAPAVTAGTGPVAPEYHAMARQAQERAQGYVERAVAGEVARLRTMKEAATPDGSGYQGEPWDDTTYAVCCNLAEFVLAGWAPFGRDDAVAVLKEHAPTDTRFTLANVAEKLSRALAEVSPRPMPDLAPVPTFAEMAAGARHVGETTAPAPATEFRVVGEETYLSSTGEALQADIAHRFAAYELGVSTLFIGGLGWHRWDGKRFAPISDDALLRTLSSWISNQLRPAQEEYNRKLRDQSGYADTPEGKHLQGMIKGYSAVLNHTGTAKGTIEWARARVRHEADEFDAHPHLLNVQNGIVDLRTGELGPHNPLKMMTKVAAVPYVPGASHPDWSAALRALPGDEVRDYMQVVFGQAATGSKPDDDRARILEGGGANGKSTIVTPFMKALGSYATVASDKILLAAGNEHTTDLTDLKGVRLALLEELPETGGAKPSINVARLKKMLGTERMKARRMRQDNIEWSVTHSLLITTNYMVAISDTDHGTWRRLCRVVFPYRFTSAPIAETDIRADPALRDRLVEGREGQHEAVLAWAIEGAKRWYANGGGQHGRMPEMPQQVQADTDAWREAQDVIFEFLNSGVVEFRRGSCVLSSELYSEFVAATGRDDILDKAFVNRLANHGAIKDHKVIAARKRTANLPLSRPKVDDARPVPPQTNVWHGLAFTDAHRTRDFFGNPGASS